ncbi:MAG TPA: L,D-transpeptidase family protein [Ferruginibacter sp.]|nr:L,D-transpeptidase family protein [Ferruginibacter sp.]HMP20512.1 L,D-transpeptidase family protein [Ferruginibacter sp.]
MAAVIMSCLLLDACNNTAEKIDSVMVEDIATMNEKAGESIKATLNYAAQNKGTISESTQLKYVLLTNSFYSSTGYKPVWSHEEERLSIADSVQHFIQQSERFGFFPGDYHAEQLQQLFLTADTDSAERKNAVLWAKKDLLLTDACLRLLHDLKFGRLLPDSTELTSDTGYRAKYMLALLQQLTTGKQIWATMLAAEPKKTGYTQLKNLIGSFLDSMDRKAYTYVRYPFKKHDSKDSIGFIKNLQQRLYESNCIAFTNKLPDSLQLENAIKKYQQLKGLAADGRYGTQLVKMMNNTDVEKFKRIAITLDRYKLLPDSMPEKYIWVNLPAYYLELRDHDTVVLYSKIICGKPETRTPVLTSTITNMITYPTWTVPTSIIAKQYLPKLKGNPYYLSRIGLKLLNEKGETVDPTTVNWEKYSRGIPYRVMQGSGDRNALGVIKFNFFNPYDVYLHDTNERWLFKKSARALSHGCVRVQEWEQLAYYIARNDSTNLKPGDTLRYTTDSIRNWLATKQTKRIGIKNRLPLFINYMSCEGIDGKIKFYDDIYADDKALREKYFSKR